MDRDAVTLQLAATGERSLVERQQAVAADLGRGQQ